MGAIGVVYGDIGTSVLYALKEVFNSGHVPFTPQNIYGILSIFFWTLTTIVSVKYVVLVLRADNNGEGGLIAMLALATTAVKDRPTLRRRLMVVGLFGDWSPVVFVGGVLLAVNLVLLFEEQTSELLDDSFLGYDFSEGYTSLDRSAPDDAAPRTERLSPLQRWRELRRLRREQDERQQQADAERQLDDLLAKVHAHGMSSLTSREQRLLKQVSDLLRERGKRTS